MNFRTPALWVLILLLSHTAYSQRTDLLYLRNGNVITGEIKKLEFGVLTFKTDDAGTITVNWDRVMRLRSMHVFELIVNDGTLAYGYGSLDTTAVNQKIVLVLETGRVEIEMHKLTRIVPIKNSIVSRIDGNFKLGLSYNKGSQVFKSNLGAEANYRSFHDQVSVVGNSTITRQYQVDTLDLNLKQDLYFQYYRIFRNRTFITGYNSLEENSELGLRLRTSLGMGFGKELFRNRVNSFNVTFGLNGNSEKNVEGNITKNLEGLVLVQYRIYKLTIPKVSMYTYLYTLPSISDPGRVRLTGNIALDFEFFKDFILGVTSYQNFDTNPATEGASKFDWGITTSIGYSF